MPVRGLSPEPAVESVAATEEVSEVSSCTEYCSAAPPSPPPDGFALNQSIASCAPQCSHFAPNHTLTLSDLTKHPNHKP